MDLSKVEKILVVTLSNLGDIVLTTPVMAALRDRFPKAFMTVIVGPKGKDLLANSATINEILIYDKTKPLFERAKWVLELRKRKFDLAVDLRNTAIPLLVGARYFNSIFFDHREKRARKKHLSRIQFLGIGEPKSRFQFFTPDEEKSALAKLRKAGVFNESWIAIVPGAANHLKRWPYERYAEIAAHFKQKGFQTVIVGSGAERAMGDLVAKCNPGIGIINACGSFEIREVAAVLSHSKLIVCNDSGLMHLANELDIPVVAIFGPTNHLQYGKFGPKNRVVHGDGSQFSIHQIKTPDVVRACEELLNGAQH